MDGVAISGVEAAEVHHKSETASFWSPMIRYEGVGGDARGPPMNSEFWRREISYILKEKCGERRSSPGLTCG